MSGTARAHRTTSTAAKLKSLFCARDRKIWADFSFFTLSCGDTTLAQMPRCPFSVTMSRATSSVNHIHLCHTSTSCTGIDARPELRGSVRARECHGDVFFWQKHLLGYAPTILLQLKNSTGLCICHNGWLQCDAIMLHIKGVISCGEVVTTGPGGISPRPGPKTPGTHQLVLNRVSTCFRSRFAGRIQPSNALARLRATLGAAQCPTPTTQGFEGRAEVQHLGPALGEVVPWTPQPQR